MPRWRAGPADPSRSARPGTATGRTSRSSPRTPSTSSSACSTTTGDETRIAVGESTAFNWHCYVPGVGPGQRYGYRVHGPTHRRGPPLQPEQAPARPLRERDHGRRRLARGQRLPYVPGRRRGRPRAGRRGRCGGDAEGGRDRPVVRLGGRPAPGDALAGHGHLRGAREGLHDAASRTCARICAGPTRASPRTRRSRTCVARRDGGRAAADPPDRPESFLVDRGLTNYWGYSSIGYLAPHGAYAATGDRGEQLREFKGMVKALHRAGIEVILDVVYNHTAEGNHLGPMLVVQGHRQHLLLPADAGRPAPLHGLHGHRQLAQPGAPERAAADHGLAALLRASSATSTASASTSPRRSRASSTTSTGSRPSSTSSTRIRSCPR